MTDSMQKRFKTLAKDRDFWSSETTATHQDLAGLFVARAVERYLKTGGRLAFVVPNSVIDRDYWSGFRDGRFEGAAVTFTPSWDLRRIRPHLFPRGSAVIFGNRSSEPATMPRHALIWTGRAPHRHASTDSALLLHQAVGELSIGSVDDEKSPYAARFAQGANLVPRVLFRVEPAKASALGVPSGRAAVQSKRSVSEKKPWKDLPDLQGTVETQFLWPVALGEQVVPFLMREPEQFVIPLTQKGQVLHGDHPTIDGYPGLADWIRKAEDVWTEHGGKKMTLAEQIDHMRKLSQQRPAGAVRVVYAASGMHVSATLITDPRVVIEHAVYWATASSLAEGHFLVGILNAPVLTELARPLMSYGKDERHIDKHVWKLPIPTFDPQNELHAHLADLAADLAEEIAELDFTSTNFVTIRRELRTRLANSEKGEQLDALVAELLDADVSEAVTPGDGKPVLIRTHDATDMPPLADVEIDVDCEFDAQGRVYLWGATTLRQGEHLEAPIYTSFTDTAVEPDEATLTATFASWLRDQIEEAHAGGLNVAWFHYGHVEVTHLRRLIDADLADTLASHATDLLADVIRPSYFAPTGYGLKTLAPPAGATWRTPGATGRDTLDWVEQARTGDHAMWKQIALYNHDDTEATRKLRATLRGSGGVGWTLTTPPHDTAAS